MMNISRHLLSNSSQATENQDEKQKETKSNGNKENQLDANLRFQFYDRSSEAYFTAKGTKGAKKHKKKKSNPSIEISVQPVRPDQLDTGASTPSGASTPITTFSPDEKTRSASNSPRITYVNNESRSNNSSLTSSPSSMVRRALGRLPSMQMSLTMSQKNQYIAQHAKDQIEALATAEE